jgi:hypothetical protein
MEIVKWEVVSEWEEDAEDWRCDATVMMMMMMERKRAIARGAEVRRGWSDWKNIG